jgi:hypothetical protein
MSHCHYCGRDIQPGYATVLRRPGCGAYVECHWGCRLFWACPCPQMESEEMQDEGVPGK